MDSMFNNEEVSLVNVKPRNKIPYLWKLNTTDKNDNILVRLASFGESNTVREPRVGDKELYVYFMSLTESGTATLLRNGLGYKPLDSIRLIFNEMLKVVRRYKVDLLVFNFPKGRMKGQEGVIKKVIEMLAKNRSRGLLEVIESGDNVYLRRKNAETKSAEEITEFLANKSHNSVAQQTRLTSKELLIVNKGFEKPVGNFRDDESFKFKNKEVVNFNESTMAYQVPKNAPEEVLKRFDAEAMHLPEEYKEALYAILSGGRNSIQTLKEIYNLLSSTDIDLVRGFEIIEQEINDSNIEAMYNNINFTKEESITLEDYKRVELNYNLEYTLKNSFMFDERVDALDMLLEEKSIILEGTTLYKNLPIRELENLDKGVFYFKGFVSCSLRPVYSSNDSILLVINIDSDYALLAGGEHNEVILPRGTILKTTLEEHQGRYIAIATTKLEGVMNEKKLDNLNSVHGFSEFSNRDRESVYSVLPTIDLPKRFR